MTYQGEQFKCFWSKQHGGWPGSRVIKVAETEYGRHFKAKW